MRIVICERNGNELKFKINPDINILDFITKSLNNTENYLCLFDGNIIVKDDTPLSIGMSIRKINYIDIIAK